jgi:hypothetical protein
MRPHRRRLILGLALSWLVSSAGCSAVHRRTWLDPNRPRRWFNGRPGADRPADQTPHVELRVEPSAAGAGELVPED